MMLSESQVEVPTNCSGLGRQLETLLAACTTRKVSLQRVEDPTAEKVSSNRFRAALVRTSVPNPVKLDSGRNSTMPVVRSGRLQAQACQHPRDRIY